MKRHKFLVVGCTLVAAFTFLIGTNYCVYEELVQGHHERDSQHSDDQFDPCCSTLQAIALSPLNLFLAQAPPSILHALALLLVEESPSVALAYAPTGLSHTARAPTPHAPFYRTTFAPHAPPLSLA